MWDIVVLLFFSSRRRHTRFDCDWSSDVCSSDLTRVQVPARRVFRERELDRRGTARRVERLVLASRVRLRTARPALREPDSGRALAYGSRCLLCDPLLPGYHAHRWHVWAESHVSTDFVVDQPPGARI